MRVRNVLCAVVSLWISTSALYAADEKLSLQCIGNAEETIWDKQKILDKKELKDVVIYYELDKNSVTQHSGIISLTQKRGDIEKESDDITERSGYYSFDESMVAYSKKTQLKAISDSSSHTFLINRKTGAWIADRSISGGYWGAIYGKDARRETKYRGNCRLWDGKNKF
jgi:hypothetical protein